MSLGCVFFVPPVNKITMTLQALSVIRGDEGGNGADAAGNSGGAQQGDYRWNKLGLATVRALMDIIWPLALRRHIIGHIPLGATISLRIVLGRLRSRLGRGILCQTHDLNLCGRSTETIALRLLYSTKAPSKPANLRSWHT